jgi:hypothetical protein
MQTYKIFNSTTDYYKNFASLQDAQTFADSLGEGYTATLAPPNEQIPALTPAEIVQMNVEFGNSLVTMFMVDNAEIGVIPESESLALLAKFQQVLPLAQLGSIKVVSELLPTLTTDAYFTQTRKDKYINLIAQYLSQF